MAYIGVQPADKYTSFAVQHFTTSATTSYTLDNPVANENEIALFINNVRQQPGSSYAYTASGTTLTLSAATSTSDTMYCVFIGKAVQTVTPANGSVTNAMLSGSIESSKLAFASYPYRNLIINGDMSIAQRGTSQSGVTASTYGGWSDRFHVNISSLGTWTISQSTDVPTGQGFANSSKFACTTADASPSANDFLMYRTKLEAQNLQNLKYGTSNAESLTLSFWVKSNKTGTYNVWFYTEDTAKSTSAQYTISSASTWEKKTITISGTNSGIINNDNGDGMRVNFMLGAGTDWTSGSTPSSWESDTKANRAPSQVNLADNTANEWYITGVQLEVGTSASDFEFLPRDVNLMRCRRYYYDSNADTNQNLIFGVKSVVSQAVTNIYLPIEMRANPSFTAYGDTGRTQANKYQVSGAGTYASANEVYVSSRMGYFLLYSPNNSFNHLLLGGFVADAEL